MKDWPLVVFTLAIQFSSGLALAATLLDIKTRHAGAALIRPLGIAIFPLAALGALASAAHLGRPLAAWRSVLNLGRSPLSQEVALTAVFVALALGFSAFWWTGRTDGRVALGIMTAAAGLAAVVSSALVYTTPAQPAWNSAWVPASFVGTALLLGGLAPTVFISPNSGPCVLRYAGGALLILAAFWMSAHWHSARSMWLGACLLLAGAAPLAFAIRPAFTLPAFIAVLLATAVGRALFYMLAVTF